MAEEFEGDLAGSVFWGADLHGARFRDVDLTGARISHSLVVDVRIDAVVDRLVVNGVDVTAYVQERDRWHRARTALLAATPEEMRAGWAALEAEWATTAAQAEALPEKARQQPVDGEFSFVQTVRHLVFAMDKWFTAPVLGAPFAALGLPNTGSLEFPWPGLDVELEPSSAEALAVLADRAASLRQFLATLDDDDLERSVEILENGPNPLRHCIRTVFDETFWHNRYARRDLAKLEASP